MPNGNESIVEFVSGERLLMKAAQAGDVSEMKKYSGVGVNYIQEWSYRGNFIKMTVLFGVVSLKRMPEDTMIRVISELLEMGADPRIKCHGASPEEIAQKGGKSEVASLLKDKTIELEIGEFSEISKEKLSVDGFDGICDEVDENGVRCYIPTWENPPTLGQQTVMLAEFAFDFSTIVVQEATPVVENYISSTTASTTRMITDGGYYALGTTIAWLAGN